MNSRTQQHAAFSLAFALFVAATAATQPARAQVADPRTPTLDSPRQTQPAPEPQTDIVTGDAGQRDPLTNLTPGAQANPATATPGNNLDAQAAAGLADLRLEASANAPVLTLTDALALALRDNPQRKAAFASAAAARARIGNARSQGRFSAGVSGNASQTRYFGTQGTSNNGSFGGVGGVGGGGTGTGGTVNTGTGSSISRTRNSESVDFAGQLPIYTGGRVKASTRVAQFNAQAQEAQRAQVEQDLILNTTLSFLNVLRTQQLLDVTGTNLEVSRERLRVARVRFDAGASARLDVLRAETDLADARQRRIQAANNLGQAANNLNTLLGRAPATPFRVQNITSLALPADLPLYVTPAASSSGQLTTPAQGVGTPGITAPTQTNPALPGATGTTGTGTTVNPGGVGIGATTPGGIGANVPGGVGSGGVPSPAPDITAQGGTTTVPGVTTPDAGIAPGANTGGGVGTGGTVGITPGSTTATPGTTTQTPGAITTPGTTTGTATPGIGTTPGTIGQGIPGMGGGSVVVTPDNSGGSVTTAGGGITATPGSISAAAGAQLSNAAGASRQSLAVTQAQLRAAQASVDLARAQRRPSLSLNPALLITNPASFLGRFAASLGLGISQTLFSGGRIASQVAEAQATVEQIRQNYNGQVLQVANGIESSLLTLDSAQRRLASADTSVVSAREAVRAAQLGFEAGARTALDVSDAQAALLSTETEAVNARYDVANAQATLAAGVGVLPQEAQAAFDAVNNAEAAQAQADAANQPKRKRRKILGIF